LTVDTTASVHKMVKTNYSSSLQSIHIFVYSYEVQVKCHQYALQQTVIGSS